MKSANEITKLLLRIPYFKQNGQIPPLHVLNDLMRRGIRDAGMSGRVEWEPFELGESEYAAVVQELRQRGLELVEAEPPPDVNSYELWNEWCRANRMGEYAAEFAQLQTLRRKLEDEMRSSEQRGDNENAGRLQLRLIDISTRISEILVSRQR